MQIAKIVHIWRILKYLSIILGNIKPVFLFIRQIQIALALELTVEIYNREFVSIFVVLRHSVLFDEGNQPATDKMKQW